MPSINPKALEWASELEPITRFPHPVLGGLTGWKQSTALLQDFGQHRATGIQKLAVVVRSVIAPQRSELVFLRDGDVYSFRQLAP